MFAKRVRTFAGFGGNSKRKFEIFVPLRNYREALQVDKCEGRKQAVMPALAARRNVEIKAKIVDAASFAEKVEIAKQLTGADGEKIVQHDVFFKVPNGRLKMRYEVG